VGIIELAIYGDFLPGFISSDRRDVLADFLSSHPWPYHSGGQITREEVLQKIDEGKFSREDTQRFWILTEANERIGLIKLFDLDDIEDDGNPLFDLRIHPAFRGQGIGKQAVTWLTRYLFETYPTLGRIEGTTRVDNLAMRKVFLSCGYVKEGHIRKSWPADSGAKLDTVIYGISREDWQNKTITPVNWNDEDDLGHPRA
jgi:RimJ/RimL family protein N-acetyltransferase